MIILCTVSLTSCTKIIDLDLDEHEQKIVIEAQVGTNSGDNSVRISHSKSLNSAAPIFPVTDADVQIKDLTTDKTYLLQETGGVYRNDSLTATVNHSYQLIVNHHGRIYTSVSTVPQNVPLVDFSQKGSLDDNAFGFENLARVVPTYLDPADRENFYQFVIYRNDSLQQDIIVRDDVVYNGLPVSNELFLEARKNDKITVDFQSIDQGAYKFLFGFSKNTSQTSGTPANPVSNISNGALGYFKAHTSNIHHVVIK